MNPKSKIGEESKNKFGSSIKITGYRRFSDIDIYFPEYDWTYYNTDYNSFKRGSVKCPYEPRIYNVGYIGEGIYKSQENGEKMRSYNIWHSMLCRCYDDVHRDKYKAYSDCYVCDEWLNYQNFASWYENNYYEIDGENVDLDKDILFKGNRIYSPDTCIFVPHRINNLILNSRSCRTDLPLGVCYDYDRNKYRAHCSDGHGNNTTIGR